jgi:large subunit ribosomal protein L29
MKTEKIRELSVVDLVNKDRDLSEEMFKLKFQHGIRPLENTAKLRELRKELARVKTIINEKRAAQQGS